MKQVDFLIIGSGIAGLSYALKVAHHYPFKKVCIITKGDEDESNTKYAQGGVAAVADFKLDSYDKHISDTLIAGDGLCNKKIVKMVVEEATERINEMIRWGVHFDKTSQGTYDLHKEGGHSAFRVMHHKDITGKEIEQTLLKNIHQTPNIEISKHHFALELITQHHLKSKKENQTPICYGAYIFDSKNNTAEKVLSHITLLATGGTGQAYRVTTNPSIATGDGIAMAYRAKAKIENMEFVQFHPTALYHAGDNPAFLISEAVRGFGAVLRTKKGEEFMDKYDIRKSLAPRDITARAIDQEMKTNGDEHVFLDCRHLSKQGFKEHFPNIYKKCLSIGINISKDMIPVVPAAHYLCGGIKVDEWGRTSIKNLYACGECASTGLHGANRLASNSLLEALVFSHRCYLDSIHQIKKSKFKTGIPEWDISGIAQANEKVLITHNRNELKSIMSDYVGIVRSTARLKGAMKRISILEKETEQFYGKTLISVPICELRNLIAICYLIILCAMHRKESIGLHFNRDFPSGNR